MEKSQSPKIVKNTSTILNDLMSKSHYRPLKTLSFCRDFLSSFPPAKQRLIARIYIKNYILNVVTLDSAAYQELNHDNSKIYIKVLIKKYGEMYPLSGFSDIKDLKIFTQKYNNTIKNNENFTAEKPYIELGLGKFENKFGNKILAKKLEEARQIIKNG